MNIDLGEGGILSHNLSTSCSGNTSPAKRSRKGNIKKASTSIAAVMKLVIDSCNDDNKRKEKGRKVGDGNSDKGIVMIEYFDLKYLYVMIEQHKLHVNFLKEHDMLIDESKNTIVSKISHIFEIIEGRALKKRRGASDGDDVCRIVSH